MRLILHKRRFRCLPCRRSFTEADAICGSYRRTTQRLRAHLWVVLRLEPKYSPVTTQRILVPDRGRTQGGSNSGPDRATTTTAGHNASRDNGSALHRPARCRHA